MTVIGYWRIFKGYEANRGGIDKEKEGRVEDLRSGGVFNKEEKGGQGVIIYKKNSVQWGMQMQEQLKICLSTSLAFDEQGLGSWCRKIIVIE